MILEAFSAYLQKQEHQERSPERHLYDWLARILLLPPAPDDMVGRVIHAEIELIDCNGYRGFEGKSTTGHQLLKSLVAYCRSYDHWQFSRWIHEVRASDFSR